MCDPVTLAIAGGVGTAVSAGGSILSGLTAAANAKKQEAAATTAAIDTVQAGEMRLQDEGIKTAEFGGTQLAHQAAGNVATNSGSPALVRENTYATGERAQQATWMNTGGALNQDTALAQGFASQAASDTTGGFINAAGTILNGASSVGSKYLAWTKQGVPDDAASLLDDDPY